MKLPTAVEPLRICQAKVMLQLSSVFYRSLKRSDFQRYPCSSTRSCSLEHWKPWIRNASTTTLRQGRWWIRTRKGLKPEPNPIVLCWLSMITGQVSVSLQQLLAECPKPCGSDRIETLGIRTRLFAIRSTMVVHRNMHYLRKAIHDLRIKANWFLEDNRENILLRYYMMHWTGSSSWIWAGYSRNHHGCITTRQSQIHSSIRIQPLSDKKYPGKTRWYACSEWRNSIRWWNCNN